VSCIPKWPPNNRQLKHVTLELSPPAMSALETPQSPDFIEHKRLPREGAALEIKIKCMLLNDTQKEFVPFAPEEPIFDGPNRSMLLSSHRYDSRDSDIRVGRSSETKLFVKAYKIDTDGYNNYELQAYATCYKPRGSLQELTPPANVSAHAITPEVALRWRCDKTFDTG